MRSGDGANRAATSDYGILVLRLAVGLIMILYGCQKMFGLFGGDGFSQTVTHFNSGMGIPPALAMMAIAVEFFGSLLIIIGLLTPLAGLAMLVNMAVATYFSAKRPDAIHDLFTSGDPSKMSGVLYPLLLCLASLAIVLLGPGKFSVDAKLFRRS
jgi:putative oxidoreductase